MKKFSNVIFLQELFFKKNFSNIIFSFLQKTLTVKYTVYYKALIPLGVTGFTTMTPSSLPCALTNQYLPSRHLDNNAFRFHRTFHNINYVTIKAMCQ